MSNAATATKKKRVNRKRESAQAYFDILVNTLAYGMTYDNMDLSVILSSLAGYSNLNYTRAQIEKIAPYLVYKDRL
jgi:hypothetical protein